MASMVRILVDFSGGDCKAFLICGSRQVVHLTMGSIVYSLLEAETTSPPPSNSPPGPSALGKVISRRRETPPRCLATLRDSRAAMASHWQIAGASTCGAPTVIYLINHAHPFMDGQMDPAYDSIRFLLHDLIHLWMLEYEP